MSEKNHFVHESSYVDEPSTIGEGTKIWHFSHILKGVSVGKKCNIGQNVVIGPNVKVGDNCKIQNNVSVYEGVELEDSVFCGPSMVFTNVINPRSHVSRKDEYLKTLVRRGASIGAKAMSRETADRYPNTLELAEDLRAEGLEKHQIHVVGDAFSPRRLANALVDWIDPDTGQPAEESIPRTEDH